MYSIAIAAVAVLGVPFLTNYEGQESTSPEEFIKEYMEANQAKDYERLADMAIDNRFKNDRQSEIDGYKMLEETTPSLVDYEIKKVKKPKEGQARVLTVLTYNDGSIMQIPLSLLKQGGEWKVYISSGNIAADKDVKILKESTSLEEFMKEYLDLGKAKKYESMAKLAIDERAPDLESRIEMYEEVGRNLVLKNYEIKEIKDVTKDKATVVTIQKFENGMINQVPMHLVKEYGNWKVHFTAKDAAADEDFKVIKQPDGMAQESASPEEFATEYLELSKAKKYEQIADMVIDERFPHRQKRIEGYEAAASYSAVEEYEIKEVKDVTEDTAKVVAVLTLKDGSVIQMALNLGKKTGVWKMYISSKGINEDKDFKLIKPATGI